MTDTNMTPVDSTEEVTSTDAPADTASDVATDAPADATVEPTEETPAPEETPAA